ncbi:MAG: hypothetical protein ACI4SF_12255 [Oscillospiraceae bacterium]
MNWKQKLTSRKWWAAVSGVVISVMVLMNVDSVISERITALITAVSSLVAYTLAEGFIDAAAVKTIESKEDNQDNE